MTKICYTFYKGVKNQEELMAYLKKHKDMPDCEMFKNKTPYDDELILNKGFIAKEHCDDELYEEIPDSLKEALG